MKKSVKIILALAAGLTALASCSKNPDIAPLGVPGKGLAGREIVFSAGDITIESKAFVETDLSRLQDSGFRVVGVCADSVMFDTVVEYDASENVFRNPDERFYFPSDGLQVNFYAVYPPSENIIFDREENEVYVRIAHNPDVDLCTAVSIGAMESSVKLNFSHCLSRVDVTCTPGDSSVDYKVNSIEISAINKWRNVLSAVNTYMFNVADDDETEKVLYPVVSDTVSVPAARTPVGETMTINPGYHTVTIDWSIYRKGSGELLANYTGSVNWSLFTPGSRILLNITLPNGVRDITMNASVKPWNDFGREITPDFEKGVFSVNATGKKVRFAPGNLYWNGSKFAFEAHQYDYPQTREAGHIGHFFWSKSASVACAEEFDDPEMSFDDILFAADGGAVEGYTVLSAEEWAYVLRQHMASVSAPDADNACAFKIAGVKCIVLVPDFFTGTLQDEYTESEWESAESRYGLVALPLAGLFRYYEFSDVQTGGYYWCRSYVSSKAAGPRPEEMMQCLRFDAGSVGLDYWTRDGAFSIRPVAVL